VEVFPPPTPHTMRALLAIDLDMSEPLTFETWCHPPLSSVGFNSDDNMTEVGHIKYFRRLLIACESRRKERGNIRLEAAFSFGSGGRHLSQTDNIEASCQ